MPLSRPMPSVGKGVHELRFRERSGIYRVVYVLLGANEIWRAKAPKGSPMKKKTSAERLSSLLRIPSSRGMESVMKAQLISAILKVAEKDGLTHVELAKRSGLPRSAVTGILSGSLQKITIDRVLKLVEAAGLVAEVKVHRKSA